MRKPKHTRKGKMEQRRRRRYCRFRCCCCPKTCKKGKENRIDATTFANVLPLKRYKKPFFTVISFTVFSYFFFHSWLYMQAFAIFFWFQYGPYRMFTSTYTQTHTWYNSFSNSLQHEHFAIVAGFSFDSLAFGVASSVRSSVLFSYFEMLPLLNAIVLLSLFPFGQPLFSLSKPLCACVCMGWRHKQPIQIVCT